MAFFSSRAVLRSPRYSQLRALSAPCSVRLAPWLPWKTKEQDPDPKVKRVESEHPSRPRFVRPRDPRTGKPRAGSNWNYATELSALAKRIGHSEETLPSLRVALTDRRLLRNVPIPSNQEKPQECTRLAVLGRSTLAFYVHEYLYFTFPKLEGSMLLDLSGHLIKNDALFQLAEHLGVMDLIKTKRVLEDPSNVSFVADVLCAVVGAVYENQGPKAARAFVLSFVVSQLSGKDIHQLIKLEHPRFMLHTILKTQGLARPESRLLKESGRATHFPTFQVGVYSGERLLGEGHGTSIKRAEREAMMAALVTQFKGQLSEAPLPSDSDPGYTPEDELSINTQTTVESNVGQ